MTRTILLADDSVTIQKVVELTFLDEEIEVVAVGSGDEALARFDEIRPALVIADVHMPGADGFEVCREIKKRSPSTPVLLLVGTFEPFDAAGVEASGAQGHLKKPFDSQELLKMALRLIGKNGEGEPAAAPAPQPASTAATSVAAPALTARPASAATSGTEPTGETPAPPSGAGLPDADVERIAKRVVELLSDKAVRDVAWEVVPDLAELVIRDRLRELESQAD